jgi:hypothetical protein
MSSNVRTWGYEYTETLLRLKRERDQWRECAVGLAGSIALAPVVPTNSMKSALAEFERLRGETK